jgi:hypothetical protein
MHAIRDLLHDIPDPNLSDTERVRLRCQLAKQFEKTGDYAAACRVMDSLWAGVGLRPDLDTLDERTSAEVLLRIGVLSGWIGAIRLIKGSQQVSRNLMTESVAGRKESSRSPDRDGALLHARGFARYGPNALCRGPRSA